MKINSLNLQNFRNHKKATFEFDENITFIFGPNGAGKTNILEAIHFLSTTKSLRATYDRELISHDEKFTIITGKTKIDGHKTKLEIAIQKSERFNNAATKTAKIDGTKKSINKFSGNLNSVLFSPTDIALLTGSPSNRRKYLNSIFFQIDPAYKKALSAYEKAVRQRNKLLENLRETGKGADLIDIWSEKILENGRIIQNKRSNFFMFLQEHMPNYANIVNGNKAKIEPVYEKNLISQERLDIYKDKERAACRTLVGPHKDDFHLLYDGHNAANFGSRGQQRATLLALKLCELDYIEREKQERPILLLDDIFSELDETHRKAVMDIMDMQQTIITSAEKDPIAGVDMLKCAQILLDK